MRINWAAEIRVSVTLVCLVLCIPGTLGSEFVWCGFGYSGWGVARRGMECRLIKNHHVLLILNVVPECLMSLYLFRLRCVSRTSVCRTSRPISRYQSYLSCHYCRCNPLYASYCDCTLTFSNTVIISCQETFFYKILFGGIEKFKIAKQLFPVRIWCNFVSCHRWHFSISTVIMIMCLVF